MHHFRLEFGPNPTFLISSTIVLDCINQKKRNVQRVRNRSRARARGAAVASNLGPILEHAANVADANVQRTVEHGPGSEQLVVHVRLDAA
jgi:hypothetical protein